jgi:hypothetical protein
MASTSSKGSTRVPLEQHERRDHQRPGEVERGDAARGGASEHDLEDLAPLLRVGLFICDLDDLLLPDGALGETADHGGEPRVAAHGGDRRGLVPEQLQLALAERSVLGGDAGVDALLERDELERELEHS